MRTVVIIVAAGAGTRLGAKIPKALVVLKRKPMVTWSLETFEKCSLIDGIILVANKNYLSVFKKIASHFPKVKTVVAGGVKRADSVRLGLTATDEDIQIVLVHDAARPLIDESAIKRLLQSLKTYKAAILGVPVKPTIKMVDEKNACIKQTLPRHLLWEAQTPQGFHRQVLVKAHQQRIKEEATDDSLLVENMKVKVKIVLGHSRNIKITTQEDLLIAEKLMNS